MTDLMQVICVYLTTKMNSLYAVGKAIMVLYYVVLGGECLCFFVHGIFSLLPFRPCCIAHIPVPPSFAHPLQIPTNKGMHVVFNVLARKSIYTEST